MRRFLHVAPGVVWAAAIVFLMLFATWLSEYFGGLPWVPPLAGLLLAVIVPVLKLLAQGETPAGAARDVAPRSWLNRWLW